MRINRTCVRKNLIYYRTWCNILTKNKHLFFVGIGGIYMDEQKKELVLIIETLSNPKLVDYLLNFIKAFLELRS